MDDYERSSLFFSFNDISSNTPGFDLNDLSSKERDDSRCKDYADFTINNQRRFALASEKEDRITSITRELVYALP